MNGRTILPMIAALALLAWLGTVRADSAGVHDTQASFLAGADGEQVYHRICQGCHMPDGQGAQGAGYYPALAGDPRLVSADYAAVTVLLGRHDMPSFAPNPTAAESESFFTPVTLTDAQVAQVVNYIRAHFGNHYPGQLTAAQVQALHHAAPENH